MNFQHFIKKAANKLSKPINLRPIFLFMLLVFVSCRYGDLPPNGNKKVNGVSFVAPRDPIDQEQMLSIHQIEANWVAIVPYAFSRKNQPEVYYNNKQKWWGESKQGVIKTIAYAQSMGLKIMLKPHVWVRGDGWPGEYSLASDSAWRIWEDTYQSYLNTITHIADSMQVEMLCIGTEYRLAVRERPAFWEKLIRQIRENYSGKLTYAANWDNYKKITFWDQLDFIGIDAYFPLCKEKNPSISKLKKHWEEPFQEIADISDQFRKPVLFTEFGYRSIDFSAAPHWEISPQKTPINLTLQKKAYEALFEKFWGEPWFAGGFLWKWFAHHQKAGGSGDKGYTPQNKPAQAVIKDEFQKFN